MPRRKKNHRTATETLREIEEALERDFNATQADARQGLEWLSGKK